MRCAPPCAGTVVVATPRAPVFHHLCVSQSEHDLTPTGKMARGKRRGPIKKITKPIENAPEDEFEFHSFKDPAFTDPKPVEKEIEGGDGLSGADKDGNVEDTPHYNFRCPSPGNAGGDHEEEERQTVGGYVGTQAEDDTSQGAQETQDPNESEDAVGTVGGATGQKAPVNESSETTELEWWSTAKEDKLIDLFRDSKHLWDKKATGFKTRNKYGMAYQAWSVELGIPGKYCGNA